MKTTNQKRHQGMFSVDSFKVEGLEAPQARKINRTGQARSLKAAELEEIFEQFTDHKWVAVFGLAYWCGARISEILSMRAMQITDTHIIIQVSKGKKGPNGEPPKPKYRHVERTAQLDSILSGYELPTEGYVFASRHNAKKPGHLSRRSADLALRKACETVGIDGVSTHSFRRSLATNLKEDAKWTDQQIQRHLGHTDIKNTSKYIG